MLSRFDIFFIRQVRHWCGELTKFKFMNISISTIHDSQCYEFKSKRLHTHHRTMPQVEIFIVRNWKYIFRRVRESGKWGWGGEAPPGHVCPCRGFPPVQTRPPAPSSPPQLRRPVSTPAIAAATDLSETEHRTAAGCGPEAASETRDTWPWPPWRGWPAACCWRSRWRASAWTWTGPRSTRATAAASSASPWRRTATSRPDGESIASIVEIKLYCTHVTLCQNGE